MTDGLPAEVSALIDAGTDLNRMMDDLFKLYDALNGALIAKQYSAQAIELAEITVYVTKIKLGYIVKKPRKSKLDLPQRYVVILEDLSNGIKSMLEVQTKLFQRLRLEIQSSTA